jgi:hypothetical protein
MMKMPMVRRLAGRAVVLVVTWTKKEEAEATRRRKCSPNPSGESCFWTMVLWPMERSSE